MQITKFYWTDWHCITRYSWANGVRCVLKYFSFTADKIKLNAIWFYLKLVHSMLSLHRADFYIFINDTMPRYKWLSARLQLLQCVTNGVIAVLQWAIDIAWEVWQKSKQSDLVLLCVGFSSSSSSSSPGWLLRLDRRRGPEELWRRRTISESASTLSSLA